MFTTVPSSTVPTCPLAPKNKGYEAGKDDNDDAYYEIADHTYATWRLWPFTQTLHKIKGSVKAEHGMVKWHNAQFSASIFCQFAQLIWYLTITQTILIWAAELQCIVTFAHRRTLAGEASS